MFRKKGHQEFETVCRGGVEDASRNSPVVVDVKLVRKIPTNT
jgi:hypothetical protein